MLLEDRTGILVLRISIDRSGQVGADRVALDFRWIDTSLLPKLVDGWGALDPPREGQSLPSLFVDWPTMRLPADMESAGRKHFSDPSYVLPELVLDGLQTALHTLGAGPSEPLWIYLDSACGMLPIVPWEHLLQHRLARPIVRLQPHSILPFTDTGGFTAILCAGSPPPGAPAEVAADRLHEWVTVVGRAIFAEADNPPLILHVFCDQASDPGWRERVAAGLSMDPRMQLNVHDPAPMTEGGESWLGWIRNTVTAHGLSVDHAHFFVHGRLNAIEGSLHMPEPHSERTSLNATEFPLFLTQIGAWSVGFTSPTPNYSVAGLRMFVHHLGILHPGITLLHDMRYDRDASTLVEAGRFIASGMRDRPPVSDALAIYAPPMLWTEHQRVEAVTGQPDVAVAPPPLTEQILSSAEPTPTWIGATQRFLEQVQSRILTDPEETAEQLAVKDGLSEAVELITGILDEHAGRSLDPSAGGPSDPQALSQSLAEAVKAFTGALEKHTLTPPAALPTEGVDENLIKHGGAGATDVYNGIVEGKFKSSSSRANRRRS